jgi:hypothetical protein
MNALNDAEKRGRSTRLNEGNLFFELSVLGFGLLVDGDIGVGVLPLIQEVFVGLPCGGFITHHFLGAGKLEPGQGSSDMSVGDTGIVEQRLELRGGRPAIAQIEIRETANVGGVHRIDRSGKRQFVLGSAAEQIDGGCRIALPQLDRGPDGGKEVMLHDRILGPLPTNLIREATSFR